MANSIEFAKNYTGILDEVYQRAAVSRCMNSCGRMVRAGRNAKEILIPKISVTGLGDYTHNVGYMTGSITYEYETHSFGYDRITLNQLSHSTDSCLRAPYRSLLNRRYSLDSQS